MYIYDDLAIIYQITSRNMVRNYCSLVFKVSCSMVNLLKLIQDGILGMIK